MHYEWKAEEQDEGGWESASYHYYVIDANADEPDAYFKTENEALEYKKDFAEYHDYVIVKIDEKYNVYNMAKPIKILDNWISMLYSKDRLWLLRKEKSFLNQLSQKM